MIDSHCHLTDTQFSADLDAVIHRAEEHGVEAMVCIAEDLKNGEKCVELAEKYDQIFCTVGVHPHQAKTWQAGDEKRLQAMLESSAKAKAIGEIGLDYHYDNSPRDVQKEVLEIQLRLAKDLGYPVVIHNRESIDDLWQIVQTVEPPRAVLHCCTETWENIQPWVERGYWLSFTGIATYPKSEAIRDTIKHCPLEQMMAETDAPYLAPVPHRGTRNESAYVREVAKCIAAVKGVPLEEVDRITSANAVEFFGLNP